MTSSTHIWPLEVSVTLYNGKVDYRLLMHSTATRVGNCQPVIGGR